MLQSMVVKDKLCRASGGQISLFESDQKMCVFEESFDVRDTVA